MGKWLTAKNARAFHRREIPLLHMDELAKDLVRFLGEGLRVVHFYGRAGVEGAVTITAVLADDTDCSLLVSEAHIKSVLKYTSMTVKEHSLHLFERELYEQTGVVPERHPWLKPVRSEPGSHAVVQINKPPLYSTGGPHEVSWGPVRSVTAESGHFRLLCRGEEILHIAIQLGYQHRGVERLFRTGNPMNKASLVESIAGDTVIAHAWAYAMAIEALSGITLSKKAEMMRSVALELERIAMHLECLSGISAGIGFLPGASTYGRLRTAVIDSMLRLSGCRFGRGLVRPGGVLSGVGSGVREHVLRVLDVVDHDTEIINAYLFGSTGVLSRLEGTGVITPAQVWEAGLVGIIAKSTGLPLDSRADQPFGVYEKDHFTPITVSSGDVYARAKIRALEIEQSIKIIRKWFHYGMMIGENMMEPTLLGAGQMVVTMVEGFRGEVSHAIITGHNSEIEYYKVVDTSFHNWMGLALAARGIGISDFPLCNESFGQSCCGHDL
ncbi:MAG: hydrogenase [Nitrospirae bacterium]|nr:hydrogenase [Nitrospirota bacterium]